MEKYQFTKEERALMESMQIPFAVYQYINKRVVTLALSDGFCELFGYEDRAEAYRDMDNDMYKDTHPDDVARIANAAFRFATQGGDYEVVYRTKKGDGYTVVHASGKHFFTDTGVRLAQVSYTDEGAYVDKASPEDKAHAEAMSKALRAQSDLKGSRYDYLTGLPNMTCFFELVEAGKDAVLERNGMPVILYTDFSGMKFFNSKYGFTQGDEVLKSFAKLMADAFGSESCCRIGSDHFSAIAEEADLEDKLHGIIRVFDALFDGKTPPVHFGVYPYRMGNVSVSSACDLAKLACNAADGVYSSCFRYFSASMREGAMLRQYIIENIDTAIREKWISVYYQPIVRAVNEQVCNEEALARWIDPEKGFLSPADFIPALEDSGLIYKLDLYVLDSVLEHLRSLQAAGHYLLPHSVNLSRADFSACDMVEEIRRRVDAAGVGRDKIVVEITESTIGSSFEYMKAQVARFRSLGFPVWMDDFGSGYSSLDLLQSIGFDLIKLDMNFMRKFDENDNGKIILTELMKMTSAMGVETVCEGVETEAHARFLHEIGCTKLQGYYFGKPTPFERVLEWYDTHRENGPENPAEAEYYEAIGRVNLYDPGIIAKEGESSLRNAFDTLPMGIIEIKGDQTRFLRSNRSYRAFIKRYFGIDLSYQGTDFSKFDAAYLHNIVTTCCEQGLRSFYDERMPDGSVVHSFARRVGINAVSGNVAVAIVVLSVSEPEEGTTYADIARALAADYYNIYLVDMDTDRYIEYSSQVGAEELAMERHGTDFFESAKRDTMTRLYEGDREMFLHWFSKDNIIRELDTQGAFTSTYRLVDSGKPMYVNMKITRLQPGGSRIIMGISVVDAYMREKEHYVKLQQELDAMGRIMALSDGYLSLYTVDPQTGKYVEYSSTNEYDSLGVAKQGEDFFRQSVLNAEKHVHKDDLPSFIAQFTRENVLREIRKSGKFIARYRLMIGGEIKPVTLKAALFKAGEEEELVIGIRA
ncbi:MAG: EAL domain-containing protein [Clostridia bacterium]|nr:EAL domain-containing protein [Clostridia bacterium]